MSPLSVIGIGALVSAVIATAAIGQESVADKNRRLLQEAVANPNDVAKVDAFVATLIEVPRGSGRYIIEGDLSITREEIVSYLKGMKSPEAAPAKTEELVVNLFGGKFDYLVTPQQRQLTYRFDTGSFPNAQAFQFTKTNFLKAADDWVAACPECQITFTESSGPTAFVIRYEDVSGGPIAQAFFPSSVDRTLRVFPSYFASGMGFDPVGVMRHELGHVLGYRHEHIQNIPGCFTEGTEWKPLTPYTPNSVMHYFCGGQGSFDLALREADKKGHRCLYLTGKACPTQQK
jgi:hypothetical protein